MYSSTHFSPWHQMEVRGHPHGRPLNAQGKSQGKTLGGCVGSSFSSATRYGTRCSLFRDMAQRDLVNGTSRFETASGLIFKYQSVTLSHTG